MANSNEVEGFSVFVSREDDPDEYIVKRIFKNEEDARDFFEKMKLKHPKSKNIEFESNTFDADADFNDEYFDGEILDTYDLIDCFGSYH